MGPSGLKALMNERQEWRKICALLFPVLLVGKDRCDRSYFLVPGGWKGTLSKSVSWSIA